jgi:hypothetical protein
MKKQQQLGINPGTAAHRLVKDLLFRFVEKSGCVCHRCGKPLVREDFSIDHKIPWLDSDDPAGMFFDIENIAYSHRTCNYGAARKGNKICSTKEDRLSRNAEIERQRWSLIPKYQQQAIRRDKYSRNGC